VLDSRELLTVVGEGVRYESVTGEVVGMKHKMNTEHSVRYEMRLAHLTFSHSIHSSRRSFSRLGESGRTCGFTARPSLIVNRPASVDSVCVGFAGVPGG
jgi:hypothetical protein